MSDDNSKVKLSPESIGAIADELESRWSKTASANTEGHASGSANKTRRSGRNLFLWGAASGIGVAFLAPLFSEQARPAVREIIKGGIKTGRYLTKLSSQIKEDVEDLTAEAKADLDKGKPAQS